MCEGDTIFMNLDASAHNRFSVTFTAWDACYVATMYSQFGKNGNLPIPGRPCRWP